MEAPTEHRLYRNLFQGYRNIHLLKPMIAFAGATILLLIVQQWWKMAIRLHLQLFLSLSITLLSTGVGIIYYRVYRTKHKKYILHGIYGLLALGISHFALALLDTFGPPPLPGAPSAHALHGFGTTCLALGALLGHATRHQPRDRAARLMKGFPPALPMAAAGIWLLYLLVVLLLPASPLVGTAATLLLLVLLAAGLVLFDSVPGPNQKFSPGTIPLRGLYPFLLAAAAVQLARPAGLTADLSGTIAALVAVAVGGALANLEHERALQEKLARHMHREALSRDHEAIFRSYLQSTQIAVLIHRGGHWIYCNDAALQLTGYSRRELREMYYWEIVPPESAPRMKPSASRPMATLEIFDKHAVCILTRSGDERWADIRVELVRFDGQMSYMVTALDMTDLKLAENAVQSAYLDLEEQVRERTSDLEEMTMRLKLQARGLDQLRDAVIITDADKMILYCNEGFQRVTGYTCNEVIGSMQAIFTGDLCSPEMYVEMYSKLEQGLPWRGTVINRRKSGTMYIEENTISPVMSDEGEITHYISVVRDISTQVAMEKRLVQSQKMQTMGQLASGIAHEVNTPIQFIGDNVHFLERSFDQILWLLTSIQMLGTQNEDHSPVEERLTSILEEIYKTNLEYYMTEIPQAISQSKDGLERVAGIVRSMLNFAHPGKSAKERISINRLIEDTLTVARHEYIHAATLVTDLAPDLPSVICHPGEIGQVILNLVVNSAQSIKSKQEKTEKMGLIEIITRECAEGVEIVLADTGTGIPSAIQEQVFEPFFTTKEVGKGTGQGLYMVHTIVHNHGGQVWFDSSEEKGTIFHIVLPLRPTEEEVEEPDHNTARVQM